MPVRSRCKAEKMARRADRQAREKAGRRAEALAVLSLRLRGYSILAKRYRTPVGEIDIVARRGKTLIFLEVKARADEPSALESVTPRQQNRIVQAASAFIQEQRATGFAAMRFDVMVVLPGKWPRHLIDAWRPQDGSAI